MRYARESAAISYAEPSPGRPRLLDEVRRRLRLKHYSLRTEEAYLYWIRRYIRANHLRHPQEMGGAEVERFLSDLARRDRVAPSTQNQALSALLFLYREVLALEPVDGERGAGEACVAAACGAGINGGINGVRFISERRT